MKIIKFKAENTLKLKKLLRYAIMSVKKGLILRKSDINFLKLFILLITLNSYF